MTYKFKTGDTGLTRAGRPYRVIADDVKGDRPIVALVSYDGGDAALQHRLDGCHWQPDTLLSGDLIPPTPAVYINVYEREDGTRFLSGNYFTNAQDAALLARQDMACIGCIRVELEARFDD